MSAGTPLLADLLGTFDNNTIVNHEFEQTGHSSRATRFSLRTLWSKIKSHPIFHRKVLYSLIISFIITGVSLVFGNALAFLRFPRVPRSAMQPSNNQTHIPASDLQKTQPLPDYGFDLIDFYCPRMPNVLNDTYPQSMMISVLMFTYLCGCIFYNNGKIGRLALQQIVHLLALMILIRATTVGVTGLPNPDPQCVSEQYDEVTYWEAVLFVAQTFPPKDCGDMIFSGHTANLLILAILFHKYNYFVSSDVPHLVVWILGIIIWTITMTGIYFTISCRAHYTVDVILGVYMAFFISRSYFSWSEGLVAHDGKYVRFIQWLEDDQGLEMRKSREISNVDSVSWASVLNTNNSSMIEIIA